jgi:3-hydroxyisobutyrate dehydrogenase-like beta-hydroxyacid dehydrogenase
MLRSSTTVGILYPGEMGAAIGSLLSSRGVRVVSTLQGRSERTRSLCKDASIEVLPSLSELKQLADIVISVVLPTAALDVAEAYRSCGPVSADVLYLDLNSVSPSTVTSVAACLESQQVDFVDGTIHGLASQLKTRGTLYLSGRSTDRVVALFDNMLRLKVIGSEVGDASAFKMMLGGMSKGLAALFLEIALIARHADALEHVLDDFEYYYPGIMSVIERLLPTYPQHAVRRGDELREVQRTMLENGLKPNMVGAAEQMISSVGRMNLEAKHGRSSNWTVSDVVQQVYQQNPLSYLE